MLEARDFTVFTDHKPLTYAFLGKKVTSISTADPQIDYDCIAETQQTDQELLHPNSIWNFLGTQKVTLSTEIMCESMGTATFQNSIMFSVKFIPGIRISAFDEAAFVWPSISSDVAKWARHSACQNQNSSSKPLSSFQEPSQRFDHVHLDLIDLYLHQMATPIA
ncbi:hypothetical protein TNCV_2762671 [Trichonephila clavipes]|nr:hypothetical protein TNCV_2762671 [Trichonephila clavipes]